MDRPIPSAEELFKKGILPYEGETLQLKDILNVIYDQEKGHSQVKGVEFYCLYTSELSVDTLERLRFRGYSIEYRGCFRKGQCIKGEKSNYLLSKDMFGYDIRCVSEFIG